MACLLLFGATGLLGRHVLQQALSAGHDVMALVRTRPSCPPEAQSRASIHAGDLGVMTPADVGRLVEGQDVLVNCAGKR